jgi:transcriptional regulator with XRE-family HTH domain
MNSLPSIDLSVSERLQNDPEFRQDFFIAESSAKIAQQLINLRKRRTLNQTQLAEKLETGQSAISRVESADYLNWSFATLRRFAAALDARIRVVIEASEDVLPEYEEATQCVTETESDDTAAGSAANYPSGDMQWPSLKKTKISPRPPAGAANAGQMDIPQLSNLPI